MWCGPKASVSRSGYTLNDPLDLTHLNPYIGPAQGLGGVPKSSSSLITIFKPNNSFRDSSETVFADLGDSKTSDFIKDILQKSAF